MAVDPDLARGALMTALLEKVQDDPYPVVDDARPHRGVVTDEEMPAYVLLCRTRSRADRFPSISLIKRLVALV